jgi:hypothetical protein
MLRPAIGLLLAFLPACFFNGNGQLQADAKDNGNGNGSNNGSNNGTGPVIGGVDPPGDGVWDITTAGGGPIAPSEVVIAGTRATGFITNPGEGTPDRAWPGCEVDKDRMEFTLDATGNTLRGTFTVLNYWTGSYCPQNQSRVVNVTGTRTSTGKNDLDGDWKLTINDGGGNAAATLHVSASSGTLSATSSTVAFAFAARKR